MFKTKTFDFANWDNTQPMITLHPTALNGEYNVSAMSINIVDVSDSSNYIEWKLYRAGTNLRAFAKYYSASNPAGTDVLQDCDANWRGYSLKAMGGGGYDASVRYKVCMDWSAAAISDGTADRSMTLQNLTGFENGAIVSLEFGSAGAIVVTQLFGETTGL